MDATELKDDLVQDMISVLKSFCARPYGRRTARLRHVAGTLLGIKALSEYGVNTATGIEPIM